MPTLIEHVERFAYTAKQIQSSSQSMTAVPGPFTRAVLETGLGDLARDVDASEIGLFTLVPATSSVSHFHEKDVQNMVKKEIARVEFPGATPLRKPAGAKEAKAQTLKDPEVYAEAALKYMDRYHSIRPMPRARQEANAIIERLGELRKNIEELNEALERTESAGSSSSLTIAEEEARIQELQAQIKQLKARKEFMQRRQKHDDSTSLMVSNDSPQISSYLSKFNSKHELKVAYVSQSEPDEKERSFWEGPGGLTTQSRSSTALAADLNDDSFLMDSNIDLGNLSMVSSEDDPTSPPKIRTFPRHQFSKKTNASGVILASTSADKKEGSKLEVSENNEGNISRIGDEAPESQNMLEEEVQLDDEDEKTVVLPKRFAQITLDINPSVEKTTARPETPHKNSDASSGPSSFTPGNATPGGSMRPKIKITADTERIMTKIWSTVGDLIMPGHPFNTALAAVDNKPPRAKETILILQNLASQIPSPDSPSSQSVSSYSLDLKKTKAASFAGHPTALQILTAHLLMTLLSSPNYSMPLVKLKEALASKGIGNVAGITGISVGLAGQSPETRALYGCVAKRLVKIDRRDREQVVRFDV